MPHPFPLYQQTITTSLFSTAARIAHGWGKPRVQLEGITGSRSQAHQSKKRSMLRCLDWWNKAKVPTRA
jgi:hypothetical protein